MSVQACVCIFWHWKKRNGSGSIDISSSGGLSVLWEPSFHFVDACVSAQTSGLDALVLEDVSFFSSSYYILTKEIVSLIFSRSNIDAYSTL